MRRKTYRGQYSRRSGAAIVELALAMVLLFGFILFILFIGRVLAERCRMLAANRTFAWMVAHQEQGKSGVLPDGVDADFLQLMRSWHFKESGIGAGIVRIRVAENENCWKDGVLVETAMMKSEVDTSFGSAQNQEGDDAEGMGAGSTGEDSADTSLNDDYQDGIKGVVNDFFSFIGDEFSHFHANIEYGTPLIGPRKSYEFYFGRMIASGDLSEDEISLAAPDQTYVFLRPVTASGCVMPLVDSGSSGSLGESEQGMRDMLKSATEQLASEDDELFRPHFDDNGEDSIVAVGQRLEALLIYEYYDVSGTGWGLWGSKWVHGHARGKGGTPSDLYDIIKPE